MLAIEKTIFAGEYQTHLLWGLGSKYFTLAIALSAISAYTQFSTLSRNELHNLLLSYEGHLELSALETSQPPLIALAINGTTFAPPKPNQQFLSSQLSQPAPTYASPFAGFLPTPPSLVTYQLPGAGFVAHEFLFVGFAVVKVTMLQFAVNTIILNSWPQLLLKLVMLCMSHNLSIILLLTPLNRALSPSPQAYYNSLPPLIARLNSSVSTSLCSCCFHLVP